MEIGIRTQILGHESAKLRSQGELIVEDANTVLLVVT